MFRIRLSPMVTWEGCSVSFCFLEFRTFFSFERTLLIGVWRTLSRIAGALKNLPVAEANDFTCYSHFFGNLGKRSTPSDHAAVRIVIQKPSIREHRGKRIPSRMSKHPVFCSLLKRLDDEHQYPADPFGALAAFKIILEEAERQCLRSLTQET